MGHRGPFRGDSILGRVLDFAMLACVFGVMPNSDAGDLGGSSSTGCGVLFREGDGSIATRGRGVDDFEGNV